MNWEEQFQHAFASAAGLRQGPGGSDSLGAAASQPWQTGLGAQSQGRRVTNELKDEMLVRRCGNICLQAREDGWKLSFQQAPGRWKFWFTRGGRAVDTHWHRDKRQALINATEALAPVLGILN